MELHLWLCLELVNKFHRCNNWSSSLWSITIKFNRRKNQIGSDNDDQNIDVGTLGVRTIKLGSDIASKVDVNAISIELDAGTDGLVLDSASTSADAIKLNNSGAAGGVDINAGTSGFDLDSTGEINIASSKDGASALVLTASAGGVDITATGAAAGEDINVTATGSSVNITSTEADAAAIKLSASDAAGGIDIDAGTGGIAIDSTGAISLDAADASNFTVTTGGSASKDLTFAVSEEVTHHYCCLLMEQVQMLFQLAQQQVVC